MGDLPVVGEVVDLPPDGRSHNRGRVSKYQRMLDDADGSWVVIYVGHNATGIQGNMNRSKWFTEGNYEVTSRHTDEPGIRALYGRTVVSESTTES